MPQHNIFLNLFELFFVDILREFNPNVTGFSTGIGSQDSPGASLNQAVPGAQSVSVNLQTSEILLSFLFFPIINACVVILSYHLNDLIERCFLLQ